MLVAGAYLAHHCVFCLLQLLLKTQHSPVIIVTIRGIHLFCRYAPPVHIFSPTCPYPQSPPERFLLSDQLTRYHRQPGKHFIPFIRHRHHHDHLNKQLVDDIQLFTDCLDNQRIHRTCRHTLHASIATGVDGEEDGGGMKMVRMVRKIGRGWWTKCKKGPEFPPPLWSWSSPWLALPAPVTTNSIQRVDVNALCREARGAILQGLQGLQSSLVLFFIVIKKPWLQPNIVLWSLQWTSFALPARTRCPSTSGCPCGSHPPPGQGQDQHFCEFFPE